MKVLVIEDSERLRRSLHKGLTFEGFAVDLVGDGEQGLSFAKSTQYDVIVLDLMLPKLDGLEVLRELRRSHTRSSVLVLSAKVQVSERVEALELGADDYLTKPFAFSELCARLRALARRSFDQLTNLILIGNIEIDLGRKTVVCNNNTIDLTRMEFQILEFLALSRGRVVSKDKLIDRIREHDRHTASNVIEATMSNLRKKLSSVDSNSRTVIQTRRGFGYVIE